MGYKGNVVLNKTSHRSRVAPFWWKAKICRLPCLESAEPAFLVLGGWHDCYSYLGR
jgi:hypothetical protein